MSNQIVELDLKLRVTAKTVRKIRAYAVLTGESQSNFVERFTTEILGVKLTEMIDALIAGELDNTQHSFSVDSSSHTRTNSNWSKHVSGPISNNDAELEDDSDLIEQAIQEEEDSFSIHGTTGGVTDDELEHDLDIENPNEEAAAEVTAESLNAFHREEDVASLPAGKREIVSEQIEQDDVKSFASLMGISQDSIEPRVIGRRNTAPKKGKGKVSNYGGGREEETF